MYGFNSDAQQRSGATSVKTVSGERLCESQMFQYLHHLSVNKMIAIHFISAYNHTGAPGQD